MKYNANSRPYCFSVKVSVLAVVFHREIKKNTTISSKIVGFLKFLVKMQQLVWKRSQKIY